MTSNDDDDNNVAATTAASQATAAAAMEENVNVIFEEEKKVDSLQEDLDDENASSLEQVIPSKSRSKPKHDDADDDDKLKTEEAMAEKEVFEVEAAFEDDANCVSMWTLSYLTPVLRKGTSKTLDGSDVGPPATCDRADACYESAHRLWMEEVERTRQWNHYARKRHEAKLRQASSGQASGQASGQEEAVFVARTPNLTRVLWRAFGYWRVWYAILLYVVSALLQFAPVLILNDLVRYFEAGAPADFRALLWHPWGDVAGLLVFPVLVSLFQTRSQVILNHCAVFIRTAVSALLFRKALGISAGGRAQTSTGQVVNMMSNDTAQLQRFLQFFGFSLVAPVQIVIALVLIYRQVQHATWVGVAFMVALIPVNMLVFANVGKMRRKVLKYSDLRVKLVNELVSGIRIIKFYSWEAPFAKEVGKLRAKELRALTLLAYTSALGFSLIMLSAPIINPILVFLTYVNVQPTPLDASTAFTTIALFNIMRFPFAFLPMGLLQFVQSRIALRRLSHYLDLPELSSYVLTTPPPPHHPDTGLSIDAPDPPADPILTIPTGSFSWTDPSATPPTPPKTKNKRRMSRKQRQASAASNTSNTLNKDHNSSSASLSRAESLASLGVSFRTTDTEQDSLAARITLSDISCSIERGSLVAVVGEVGSGKTSFLSAILGEMEPIDNSLVHLHTHDKLPPGPNHTTYCSQSPWVMNDTLRGNILFGRPYDAKRYQTIVSACALTDDLATLPAGDATEIGERGINLSGGQKARVALARAMYSPDTKLMLLDDPLSAVDAHVGEHLFEHAIRGNDVGEGKTRILVTHHVHFLPRCDTVIVLEKGKIKHCGKYQDLLARGVDFAGAVDVGDKTNKKKEEKDDDDNTTQQEESSKKNTNDNDDGDAKEGKSHNNKDKDGSNNNNNNNDNNNMKQAGKKLIKDEEREEGSVDGSMYTHYAQAGGVLAFISVFIIQGFGRSAEVMSGFWLSIWAEATTDAILQGDPLTESQTSWYLNIYAVFGMAGVVCTTVRSLAMAVHRLHASRKLHNELTDSILKAPVAFFDVTPIGRVLNRFSADMDKIDLELTQSLGQSISTLYSVLGAVGAIVAATKGTLLAALVPIGYLNYIIQKWFRKSSTELQRAASVANSPIFTDFSQMLSGTPTIRAYGKQTKFFKNNQTSFDKFNAIYSITQQANYWLGLRLDVLGGSIGVIIAALALATHDINFIPAGWLGLALSYSIEVTGFLKHGVRMIATLEAQMNSVERVMHYSNNIESEAAPSTPQDPKLTSWPNRGRIEIHRISMRYRDGPLVLKDVSVSIRAGEKIGVVGRTGSGKSSLMSALFRITEIERDGIGKITIDDVDITQIGLNALRLSLSIIPQDPVMFSNTIRYNLDPFGNNSEYELWEALKKVQLAEAIAVLPLGLDEHVTEGGENFSQGQRQLLCIARSLLRKPKILVMDEATASIDNTTDAAIQNMIRENFASATVLTIAHRLNTIMDSDRVLVLDDGHVAEFDSPSQLMEQGGIFAEMVAKSKHSHGGGGGE